MPAYESGERSAIQALDRLRKLQTVTDAALEPLALDALLDVLLTRIRTVLEADTSAVLLVDERTDELVARAAKGLEEEVERGVRIPVGAGFAGRIAAERRPVVLDDVDHADVLNPLLREKGIKSLLGVPLIVRERVLGVVHVGTLVPRTFTPDDAELLSLVAQRLAVALERAMIHEEVVRLERLEREFVALASHELRTPASVIYGISETLAERGDDLPHELIVELREALREHSARLRRLVEQLLDLSRLGAADLLLRRERLELRSQIERIVATLEVQSAAQVRIEVPDRVEVDADPVGLEHIFGNLLSNAFRYGEPPVIVSAAQEDTYVHVTIEDRGRGVAQEFVPRLFERFTRSPQSEDESYRGAGLGLAIARAYTSAHGGSITYEAVEPCGARFRVTLPAAA